MFVDGWTGKGAITRELAAALRRRTAAAFDPELAVLADPGRCARTFGTRDDFLIPSACLNSTVSGLVSRTVLNDRLIGPGESTARSSTPSSRRRDVSSDFLDAVAAPIRRASPTTAPARRRPHPRLGRLGAPSSASATSTASAT